MAFKCDIYNCLSLCMYGSCLQFTRFKCGGLAVGMSWAHVVGDAVSAANSINLWGHFTGTKQPPPELKHKQKYDNKINSPVAGNPQSIKKVEPVGDFWLTSTDVQMTTYSFQISESNLKHLQSKVSDRAPAFETVSALIWQSLAKIRVGREPNLVTIIRNDTSEERKFVVGNKQTISTVSSDCSVAKLELSKLAMLMSNANKDEKQAIEEMVEKESGKEDYIVYGANLTFVDMQGINLYGLEIKGEKTARVDCTIHGMGEEGAVLLLPGPGGASNGERVLTVILPEHEISELKQVLESKWSIA